MTILVTGGAGFIGSSFVIDWVANTTEPVINLDKLTYADDLEHLARIQNNQLNSFVQYDQFIAALENRQGLKVACPEEIAFRQQWIDAEQLERLAQPLLKNGYGKYLMQLLNEKVF